MEFEGNKDKVDAAKVEPMLEKVEQWKKQHGDVYQVTGETDNGEEMVYYFRKPDRPDLSRFSKELAKDMYKATNNLVFGTLLYPATELLRKQVDEKPGLVLALGAELQKIIGSNQDFLSKKL